MMFDRTKKLIATFVATTALAGGLAATAEAITNPPGTYEKGLTFQYSKRVSTNWVLTHYDYVEELLPTLFVLRCQKEEVNILVWEHTIEPRPAEILYLPPTAYRNFEALPCGIR